MIREIEEEVGVDISKDEIKVLSFIGQGEAEKVLQETGEKVLVNMQFNRLEVHKHTPLN